MFVRIWAGLLCSLTLSLTSPALASDVILINFDLDPEGIPLADGTVINTTYSSQGVVFSAVGPGVCGTPPAIYARTSPIVFGSAPNVVSTCPPSSGADISEANQGMVRADIVKPANMVWIDVHAFDGNDRAVMRAYSFSGDLIDEVFSSPGVSERLTVTGCGIQRVEFSGAESNAMLFDNLIIVFENRVMIDFDHDVEGSPLAHGTVINYTYVPWGVAFHADPVPEPCGIDDQVLAHSNQPHSFGSSPNVVTTCHSSAASDISENSNGIVHADFDRPACAVCINVHVSTSPYQGILRGYDAGDALVATAESAPGAIGTICISAPEILAVTFSGKGDTYARFDDLTILFSTDVVDATSGPTGSHLALRSVFPNPASHSIQIAFTLPRAAPATLQLVDVAGRILASETLDDPAPGDHLVRLSPGESPARGVYFVRLKQGMERQASKVVFLK